MSWEILYSYSAVRMRGRLGERLLGGAAMIVVNKQGMQIPWLSCADFRSMAITVKWYVFIVEIFPLRKHFSTG